MSNFNELGLCDCNAIEGKTSRVGTRVHVDSAKGIWCAVKDDNGAIFVQNLITPNADYLATQAAKVVASEIASQAMEVDMARHAVLSGRLDNGEDLTMQELNELTRLGRKIGYGS